MSDEKPGSPDQYIGEDGRVVFEIGKRRVSFRVPDTIDLCALDKDVPALPDLEGETDLDAAFQTIAQDREKVSQVIRRCDALLVMCSVGTPHVVDRYSDEPENGTLPVRAIPDMDRFMMATVLMGLSGYNKEAAARLVPLSEIES